MRFGRLRQDDDCHWYVVPTVEVVEFDALLIRLEDCTDDQEREVLNSWFYQRYGKYMTDALHNLKVVIGGDHDGVLEQWRFNGLNVYGFVRSDQKSRFPDDKLIRTSPVNVEASRIVEGGYVVTRNSRYKLGKGLAEGMS